MTAYWINFFTRISDPDRVARYAALAGPAMLSAGGRFLARGDAAQTLEGGATTDHPALRTTLIAFDSVEAAVAAYHSPAYQEALRVLGDAAEREVRIIPAVPDS
jgi:uncharacterized protein (DUF1330 family)